MYYPCSENKELISFAVTAKLICAFAYTYVLCWFSHDAAHCFPFFFKLWLLPLTFVGVNFSGLAAIVLNVPSFDHIFSIVTWNSAI